MRRIGISVYPSNATLQENLSYIELAKKYGCSKLFLCMMSVLENDNIKKDKLDDIVQIATFAKNLGFEVVADVSSSLMKVLNIDYLDLSYFRNLNLSGIRLDEGFGGNQEAIMTFNDDLLIELNTSVNDSSLDNIMRYYPNVHNLVSCHNFYPKRYTGLSREVFIRTSMQFKSFGIRVAAFINAPSAKFGPWAVTEGLCTLEDHRYLSIDTQAKELFYSNLVDDVLIANAFASEEDLKKLSETPRDVLTLDVIFDEKITEIERKIALDELHYYRGDASIYSVRSTMPRIKYKEYDIAPGNTSNIQPGDVFIENSQYKRYKGELSIALDQIENKGCSNIIGKIREDNIPLLYTVHPWQKFKLQEAK